MTAYNHRRLTAYYYSSGRRTSDHLCCSAGVFHCSVGVLLLFRGIAEVHSSCEEFVFSVRFFFFFSPPSSGRFIPVHQASLLKSSLSQRSRSHFLQSDPVRPRDHRRARVKIHNPRVRVLTALTLGNILCPVSVCVSN